jgi:hypothetical protein
MTWDGRFSMACLLMLHWSHWSLWSLPFNKTISTPIGSLFTYQFLPELVECAAALKEASYDQNGQAAYPAKRCKNCYSLYKYK